MRRHRLLAVLLTAGIVAAALPALAIGDELGFDEPVYVSDRDTAAAEPSIRVDVTHPDRRIWVAAPSGLGADTRVIDAGGDLFWYSDDDGRTWTQVTNGAGSVSDNPTILGGGDSDIATTPGGEVYVTGLTLANVTLGASTDEGASWFDNPISNIGSVEDRQWIDAFEDTEKPGPAAPDFVLNYGGIAEGKVWFHQVFAPAGAPPVAGPRIDATHSDCQTALLDDDCYQWPGNLAVDETTGDVYVTYQSVGSGPGDAIVVTRVAGGAAGPVTQADVTPTIVARTEGDAFDSFTVVATDREGNVYVVWSESFADGQHTDTKMSVSTDQGATWSDPVTVNSAPRTTVFPWIVAGDAGRVGIVYYGTDAAGDDPESVPTDAKWKVWYAQSLNALDPAPTFDEVAATGVVHENIICTSGTGCDSGTRSLLDFFQVDIDEKGYANIAYTDNYSPKLGAPSTAAWVTFVQQNSGPGLYAEEFPLPGASTPTPSPSPTEQ